MISDMPLVVKAHKQMLILHILSDGPLLDQQEAVKAMTMKGLSFLWNAVKEYGKTKNFIVEKTADIPFDYIKVSDQVFLHPHDVIDTDDLIMALDSDPDLHLIWVETNQTIFFNKKNCAVVSIPEASKFDEDYIESAVIHELAHLFGAFHDTQGIMNGNQCNLRTAFPDDMLFDSYTLAILYVSSLIRKKLPPANVKYIVDGNVLISKSDEEDIFFMIFVYDTFYTCIHFPERDDDSLYRMDTSRIKWDHVKIYTPSLKSCVFVTQN